MRRAARTMDASFDTIRAQDSLSKAMGQIQRDNPFLNGVNIEVGVSTSVTIVPHGLGRAYQGYILTYANASVSVYVDETSDADPTKFIPLKGSATATVKVQVF